MSIASSRRGEIRGGRFVAGFAGEQFALPEAIGALREVRRNGDSSVLVSLSAADPLNLAGVLTPRPNTPWRRVTFSRVSLFDPSVVYGRHAQDTRNPTD
jgi:hypothetical protein